MAKEKSWRECLDTLPCTNRRLKPRPDIFRRAFKHCPIQKSQPKEQPLEKSPPQKPSPSSNSDKTHPTPNNLDNLNLEDLPMTPSEQKKPLRESIHHNKNLSVEPLQTLEFFRENVQLETQPNPEQSYDSVLDLSNGPPETTSERTGEFLGSQLSNVWSEDTQPPPESLDLTESEEHHKILTHKDTLELEHVIQASTIQPQLPEHHLQLKENMYNPKIIKNENDMMTSMNQN